MNLGQVCEPSWLVVVFSSIHNLTRPVEARSVERESTVITNYTKTAALNTWGVRFDVTKKQSRGSLDASRHGPGHTVARAAARRDPRALNTTTRTLLCGSCHPPHHSGPLRTCQPTFGTSDRSWTNSQSSDLLHRFLFKQNISFSNNKL